MQHTDRKVAYGDGVGSARSGRRGDLIKYLRSQQRGHHVLNRYFVSTAHVQHQEQQGQGEYGEVNGDSEEYAAACCGRAPAVNHSFGAAECDEYSAHGDENGYVDGERGAQEIQES